MEKKSHACDHNKSYEERNISVLKCMHYVKNAYETSSISGKYEDALNHAVQFLEIVEAHYPHADILLIKVMESIAELYKHLPSGEKEAEKYFNTIIEQCDVLDDYENRLPIELVCQGNRCSAFFLEEYKETIGYCKGLIAMKEIHLDDSLSFTHNAWGMDLIFD